MLYLPTVGGNGLRSQKAGVESWCWDPGTSFLRRIESLESIQVVLWHRCWRKLFRGGAFAFLVVLHLIACVI